MNPLDVVATIGEVFAWIGLALGVPLLLAGAALRAVHGAWEPVEIAIVTLGGERRARWFTAGDFRERRLRPGESGLADGWHEGFVSTRRPGSARFGSAPAGARLCTSMGWLFATVGLVGFLASWLPVFL